MKRVGALVDWDKELGAITCIARQRGHSGLLFENIKDYQSTWCRKVFTGSLVNQHQVALMLGLPKHTHQRDLVKTFRERSSERVKPVVVKSGSIKENIRTGDHLSLFDIPVPVWNRLDGGRYINTLGCIVTRDPDSGIQNLGIYRGVVVDKNRIAQVIMPRQHIGQHFAKYQEMGKEMPIAVIYGWDPVLAFMGCAPVAKDVCEYDVMGGVRQEAVELVKCETSDLEVPASAEIVVEGFVSPDPATYEMEGPFGEFTGYYTWQKKKKPVIRVECITHRNDPIFVGALASALPGQRGEGATMMSVHWAARVAEIIERSGIPGLVDVRMLPPSCETSVILKIHKTYRGQGKHIACALIGSSMPLQSCKNIIVVDDDIDIYDSEAISWAVDYRVNPSENDILILPGMAGSAIDPSIRPEHRDTEATGGAAVSKMIIDATKNWSYGRRKEWDNDFYPPVNRLSDEDRKYVEERWKQYGL